MTRKRSSRIYVAALVVASLAAVGYKAYDIIRKNDSDEDQEEVETPSGLRIANPKKSIALTLLHSILSSGLPLADILLSAHNVTFILPPYLSIDDLEQKIELEDKQSLLQSIVHNYKLLKCSNIDGYFNILKNLRPEKLFVCSEDLGISGSAPTDLSRFVKEIVVLDQNNDHIHNALAKVFFR